MKYEWISLKNRKLLKKLSKYGDVKLELRHDNPDLKKYCEADIYELIECGYFKCDFPTGHVRTFDNNWSFVGFLTYKGFHYDWGITMEIFKSFGSLGGWIALINFIISIVNILI